MLAARLATLLLAAAAVVALAAPLAGGGADAVLDPAAFTRRYAEEARKALPDAKVEIRGELEVRVSKKGADGPHTVYLDNPYAEYRQAPEELDQVFARSLRSLKEVHEAVGKDRTLAIDRIVPVVKGRAWVENVARSAPGMKLVTEELNGAVVVAYAEDTPANMRYLSAEDLRKAGIKPAELRALAVRNLLALLPEVRVEGGKAGVYMVIADGNYEATLILADAVLAKLPKVDGELVVAIPARDVFVFTGSNNAVGVAALRKVAADLSEQAAHALTPALLVRRGGKFEVL